VEVPVGRESRVFRFNDLLDLEDQVVEPLARPLRFDLFELRGEFRASFAGRVARFALGDGDLKEAAFRFAGTSLGLRAPVRRFAGALEKAASNFRRRFVYFFALTPAAKM
jgi:hypothetical protein